MKIKFNGMMMTSIQVKDFYAHTVEDYRTYFSELTISILKTDWRLSVCIHHSSAFLVSYKMNS